MSPAGGGDSDSLGLAKPWQISDQSPAALTLTLTQLLRSFGGKQMRRSSANYLGEFAPH